MDSSKGVPRWDTSIARSFLKKDIEAADEAGTKLVPKDLWLLRDIYQMWSLKEFRNKISQFRRYKTQSAGWVSVRNQQGAAEHNAAMEQLARDWNRQLAGNNPDM